MDAAAEDAFGDGLDAAVPYADVLLPADGDAVEWSRLVLERIVQLASGRYEPVVYRCGNVDFQIARGTAVSL